MSKLKQEKKKQKKKEFIMVHPLLEIIVLYIKKNFFFSMTVCVCIQNLLDSVFDRYQVSTQNSYTMMD